MGTLATASAVTTTAGVTCTEFALGFFPNPLEQHSSYATIAIVACDLAPIWRGLCRFGTLESLCIGFFAVHAGPGEIRFAMCADRASNTTMVIGKLSTIVRAQSLGVEG